MSNSDVWSSLETNTRNNNQEPMQTYVVKTCSGWAFLQSNYCNHDTALSGNNWLLDIDGQRLNKPFMGNLDFFLWHKSEVIHESKWTINKELHKTKYYHAQIQYFQVDQNTTR